MMKLVSLFIVGGLMSGVNGFIFRRSSSSSTHQSTSHVSTNNCHCNNQMGGNFMEILMKLFGKNIGKRDAAAILDLDEDYPGLNEFMEHAGMKRDGTIDTTEFTTAVKRAASQTSQSNSPNVCHCGRMVVDQFNDLL